MSKSMEVLSLETETANENCQIFLLNFLNAYFTRHYSLSICCLQIVIMLFSHCIHSIEIQE